MTVCAQAEGEELEVLRGLDEACWTRVQQVALEVHDCIDGEQQPSFGSAAAAQPCRVGTQQFWHLSNSRSSSRHFCLYERLHGTSGDGQTGCVTVKLGLVGSNRRGAGRGQLVLFE